MSKRHLFNDTEKTAYVLALKHAIKELQLKKEDLDLLMDYFVNEISLEELSNYYLMDEKKVQHQIDMLKQKFITLASLNEERNSFNLKGKNK